MKLAAPRVIRGPRRQCQQAWRHGEAERLGDLEVDHQLVFGRLLDRQVGGFAPRNIRSTYSAACRNWLRTLAP